MSRSNAAILDRVFANIPIGTAIPKPAAKAPFRVKGEGVRRGERAVIYTIPSHRSPPRKHEKGITDSELDQAYCELRRSGQLKRDWFNAHLKKCASEGACNFTTIGGLLILLGEAEYGSPGVYRRLKP